MRGQLAILGALALFHALSVRARSRTRLSSAALSTYSKAQDTNTTTLW
ncbi:hypothetical protein [Nannocystis bainbridge]|uniref:Uncharacterized protein n=1 Tax=Nannocystis bainbridge TaxID=2995303 RepID=A0ABT5E291_9BACT|nr:hypothetical protein [Nannocystis bainbridge]MDC0719895.1 hypothetical protein [Nannocystis bainbridge]